MNNKIYLLILIKNNYKINLFKNLGFNMKLKFNIICYLFFCLTLSTTYMFGYEGSNDLARRTTHKGILETFAIDQTHSLFLLEDGSLWNARSTAPGTHGRSVNIENYLYPQEGNSYSWVWGRNEGDEVWEEYRSEAKLLFLSSGDQEALPFESHSEDLTIALILYDGNREILILENNSLIAIPSYHRGFSVGEIVKLHLMKNGKNGYLVRQIENELLIAIPLDRGSAHIFMGH